jgi:predicted nucleic acid-binding protein
METVYIETSVISYLVSEPSRDLIIAGHQQITREWWERHRQQFQCVVSQLVLDEAASGDARQAEKRLTILRGRQLVPITPAVIELAEQFIRSGALPPKAARDAYHVAASTVHRLDYLATWNCRHIANAQVLKKLQPICAQQGLALPVVCTLEELMGD